MAALYKQQRRVPCQFLQGATWQAEVSILSELTAIFNMSGSDDKTCDVLQDLYSYLQQLQSRPETALTVVTLLTSSACLLICLLLNIYIAINVIYTGKFKIRYFTTFLLLLTAQLIYLSLSLFSLVQELLPQCFPSTELTKEIVSVTGPVCRSALGVTGCLVGALTIERFLSSTAAGAVLRFFLNSLTLLLAICGPVSVVVFFILIKLDLFQSLFDLDTEFWFGVEVGVYIILPLLLLTIFGTVNCCKVSMSSRMLPTNQVQAIKINIGLTVTTNLTLFLFLVQECLRLWQRQLVAREDWEEEDVKAVLLQVSIAQHSATLLLNVMVSLTSIIYCTISSICCHDCCCPAINELEQIRYEQVDNKDIL